MATTGDGPSQRADACAVWAPDARELLVYGGRAAAQPGALLSDVHALALHAEPPAWRPLRPRLLAAGASASAQQQQTQQQGMLPLAGHVGGVAGGSGDVLFLGGYARPDQRQGQPMLQVLARAVRPPTPEAAKLAAAASQQQLAAQHVRLAVARLVKAQLPRQVHLAADGGGGVRLPARLLALYSALFDDLFQELLDGEQEADSAGGAADAGAVPTVPVPGVAADDIAAVCRCVCARARGAGRPAAHTAARAAAGSLCADCDRRVPAAAAAAAARWMMGLLTLAACSVDQLVAMYRAADRLVVEALQLEVLDELRGRQLAPHDAAAVMALAGAWGPPARARGA